MKAAVPGRRREAASLLAVIVGAALIAALLRTLPRDVPSPLVTLPAPVLAAERLDAPGQPLVPPPPGRAWVLNVWASWCVPCLAEHPLLLELARSGGVPIVGLNHLDRRDAALAWLARHGNPYSATGFDPDGLVARDWGVAGVPQTFVIDGSGTVRLRHVGRLTPEVVEQHLRPLLVRLAADGVPAKK